MQNILRGKKTYLNALGGAVVIGAYLTGYIDTETATALGALFGFSGIASLRAGIAKGR